MTAREAKQRLERIWKDYTSAYDTASIEDLMAFDMATNALGAIEQIQWERDMAIKQLHDLGYGLGEKPREEVKKASDADRILKILESAKDKNGDVPMSIVRKAFDKLLPSAQPDVPDTNVGDMISRRMAMDALSHMMDTDGFRDGWAVSRANVDCMLRALPSAQPEIAIPLSWIEKHIEWLKSMDNAFSDLIAMNISVMVKKWKEEKERKTNG